MRLSTKIYDKRKELFISKSGLTDEDLSRLLRMDTSSGLGEISRLGCGSEITQLYSFLWNYKRSLHAVVSMDRFQQYSNNIIDMTRVAEINKSIEIDTVVNGQQLYMHVSKLKNQFTISGVRFTRTITLFNEKSEAQLLYFSDVDKQRFVVYTNRYRKCTSCGKCHRHCTETNKSVYKYDLSSACDEFSKHWCSVRMCFRILYETVIKYIDRDTVTVAEIHYSNAKDRESTTGVKERKLMTARDDGDDTERVLSPVVLEYKYRESPKRKSLGGTHKSPVSHQRSGYFRKSKHGSYVMVGEDFIQVPRGTGNFTWVDPTIVNPNKSTSVADMI